MVHCYHHGCEWHPPRAAAQQTPSVVAQQTPMVAQLAPATTAQQAPPAGVGYRGLPIARQ
jgi:hypothetical protein